MDFVPLLLAGFAGFCLGSLVTARAIGWLGVIESSRKKTPRVAQVLAVILHSGPWLLAGMLLWAYFMLSRPHALAWEWFFIAAAVAPFVLVAAAVYMNYRGRKVKPASGKSVDGA